MLHGPLGRGALGGDRVTLSYRKSIELLRRDLSTTCPDGVVIETPWDAAWTWCESARLAQAEQHRQDVRFHLATMRLLEKAA